MILISHRGNTNGSNKDENNPKYIDNAIEDGYDVEIDIWCINELIYLGHESPQYLVDFSWIIDRVLKLWIHCKNINALIYIKNCGYDIRYFWHQSDDVTITSNGFFWTYPGKQLTKNSIAVMPETKPFNDIEISYGICSDYIIKYKDYIE